MAGLDMAEHTIAHEELCSTIPKETLALWIDEVEAWEKNVSQPNPFEETTEGIYY
jgi:hypothetical protein